MSRLGWVFTLVGTASGVWGITDTLVGNPVTGLAGMFGMIVAYAVAMAQED